MTLRAHCDGCDVVADNARPTWLKVLRGGGPSFFDAAFTGRPEDPDPLLGNGLTFHSYDCLRVWLMTHHEATR